MITQNNTLLNDLIQPLEMAGSHHHFAKLIEEACMDYEQKARDSIKNYLEEMDRRFRHSTFRTEKYYIKDTRKRTIVTMMGEISYTRTIYIDRYSKKRYCYVDEKMGIDKWIRFTSDVASYVYEAYCDENSMIKIGKEVGNLIHGKYFINEKNVDYSISRASIRNMIKRIRAVRIVDKSELRVKHLYLLLDEKYIASNKKDDGKIMVKSALLCEGLNRKNAHRPFYINPFYFCSYKGDFTNDLIDVIENRYDLKTLKTLHILSDGGTWIKTLKKDMRFKDTETIAYLDHFHFSKALWKILKDKNLYNIAFSYLKHNAKDQLRQLLKDIDKDKLYEKERKYILDNYDEIQNMIHLKDMNCAAEQFISHHLSSQFANVGKGYRKEGIDVYLSMRDNFRNHQNMKLLYLKATDVKDDDECIKLEKPVIDCSVLSKEYSHHDYTTQTVTGDRLKMGHF